MTTSTAPVSLAVPASKPAKAGVPVFASTSTAEWQKANILRLVVEQANTKFFLKNRPKE
ncbi:hypothetical protein AGMMS50289_21160 [Betaproteobacteria bacterium]|nr:hypothetical protein AGMMS50289_21160 [Betaproteobacteria bacterium]